MEEIYWIDDIPPRRRLRLWHLATVVAASAVMFAMMRSTEGKGLLFGFLLLVIPIGVFTGLGTYGISLMDRVDGQIGARDDPKSKAILGRALRGYLGVSLLTLILGFVAFVIVLVAFHD